MIPESEWLARYLEGDHEVVWHELRQIGARVREPEYVGEAQAVCDEVARRVRRNLEVVVARLDEQGFRFHTNDDEQRTVSPLSDPIPDAEQLVAWLESSFGPVPLVLSSWVRIVGDVWLVGTHPDWGTSASADPLVVEIAGTRYPGHDFRSYLIDELEQWSEDPQGSPFRLPIAPDRLHKENVSGGAPYGIALPDACADGQIRTDADISFVSYLRQVFRQGGFPGWSGDERQWSICRSLALGLERF